MTRTKIFFILLKTEPAWRLAIVTMSIMSILAIASMYFDFIWGSFGFTSGICIGMFITGIIETLDMIKEAGYVNQQKDGADKNP
jgi:hypothetical protein